MAADIHISLGHSIHHFYIHTGNLQLQRRKRNLILSSLTHRIKIVTSSADLKCYSQISCEGSANFFRFWPFGIVCWQSDKKQGILRQTCKDLFILAEQPITIWIIIRCDNIFNIEVNAAYMQSTWLCTTCSWKIRIGWNFKVKLLKWPSVYWWPLKQMTLKSVNLR